MKTVASANGLVDKEEFACVDDDSGLLQMRPAIDAFQQDAIDLFAIWLRVVQTRHDERLPVGASEELIRRATIDESLLLRVKL